MTFDPTKFYINDEIRERSAMFRQGDVLCDLPYAYNALRTSTSGTRHDDGTDTPQGVTNTFDFAIITTQTCDIAHPEKVAGIPFINVAPIINAFDYEDKKNAGLITSGHISNLVPIPPEIIGLVNDDETLWAANLAFDFPVERSIFLNREPIRVTPEEYKKVLLHISQYRSRPAFGSALEREVIYPLERALAEVKDHKKLELFLELDDPINPAICVPYVLVTSDEQQRRVEDALNRWYQDLTSTVRVSLPKIRSAATFTRADCSNKFEFKMRFNRKWRD